MSKNQGDGFWRRIISEVELGPPYIWTQAPACTMCSCAHTHTTFTSFGVCILFQLLSASPPQSYHHKLLRECLVIISVTKHTSDKKCGTGRMRVTPARCTEMLPVSIGHHGATSSEVLTFRWHGILQVGLPSWSCLLSPKNSGKSSTSSNTDAFHFWHPDSPPVYRERVFLADL